METQYTHSDDGTRVAFDVSGQGPTLFLLHGGYESRQRWHEVGYIDRLKDFYRVIAIDIRGHGESDKPIDPNKYTIDLLVQDVFAVADTCNADRFALWGFSFGGNISRYVAAQADRVVGTVIMGINFGYGAEGEFRNSIEQMNAYWQPILEAQRENKLDLATLSEQDRAVLQQQNLPVTLAWLSAMLEWGTVLPDDISEPVLWLIGSKNALAMESFEKYREGLSNTHVQVHVVDGFTHEQEFSEIDKVFPVMLEFTRAVWNAQDTE